MKTKSKLLTLAATVTFAAALCAAGVSSVAFASAEAVNGWEGTAPAGAAANYGSNIAWPLAPTDAGNGYTKWCFNNGHTVANSTRLDVSKPIVISYSCKSNVSDDGGSWIMFGLATSFESAAACSTGLQEAGNRTYSPFFCGHQMADDTNGYNQLGATVTYVGDGYSRVSNKCGTKYDASVASGDYATMEIYFGAENAADGYILVDGVYVGYPKVVQSAYTDGAYLVVSGFASGFFTIKTVNADTVTDIKDYTIGTSAENATLTFSENDVLRRANAGEKVSFTVDVTEGYRIKSVKAGDEVLTADENGLYTFTMPAGNVTVTVETEIMPDMYAVSYSGSAAEVNLGTDVYEVGQTVSFTVSVKSYYRLISVKADGTELTADADGNYTFTMPERDVEIVVEAEKIYSEPSASDVAEGVNGWFNSVYAAYPQYGATGSSMTDAGDGYANFVLDNSGYISSVVAFDVTKPVYLDILVQPNTSEIPGAIPWFMIGLFDDWDIIAEAGADAYGTSGGQTAEFNEKINAYKKLMISFNYSDINSSTCALSGKGGLKMESEFTLTNKFGSAWGWDGEDGTDFDYATFEFYIGASAGEGYIKIDGVKVATPSVKQADFHNGVAYLNMLSFYSARVQAKIYAAAELDYTSETDSRAEIEFAEGTDLASLKTYDTVSFTVSVPQGYGALVKLDSAEINCDENGVYTAVIGYGKSVLSVAIAEKAVVTFETNGGGTLDPATVTIGGTVTEPTLERNGYLLTWYADSEFTAEFDFSEPITESCTVYAKWTPIEYTISYYDGANKIRDILPVSYNVETETTALPVPQKEGYVFEGWYQSATFEGDRVEAIEKGTTGNFTLYARWSEDNGSNNSDGGNSGNGTSGNGTSVSGGCGSSLALLPAAICLFAPIAAVLKKKRSEK